MKKILVILFIIVSTAATVSGDDSHSDSSNSCEWQEIVYDYGNYDTAEYYDDGWNQDDEEDSFWSSDIIFTSNINNNGYTSQVITVSEGESHSSISGISISCFMYGDDACHTKCNLQCTLYDCTPRTSCCDDDFHCNCDEVYEFGSDQLTQSDFELLDFNDLWGKTFEDSIFSRDIRKLIRADKKFEAYILGLLRNPHVSGDDIITLLNDKRPYWSDLFFLKSKQHFKKTELLGAGKPLKYNDLNDHIDQLYELMETAPLDNVGKVKYRRRIRKFLQNITNIDDLEELLYLIRLSGNKKLYQLAKSVLKNLGYGFEEDGEKSGKKGILRNITGELADANEDEIMDIVTLNKFMSQSSTNVDEDIKGPIVIDKLYQSGETSSTKMVTNQQPVTVVSDLNYKQNTFSTTPPSVISNNNAAGFSNGQILPLMPIPGSYENAVYFSKIPAADNANLMTAASSNIQSMSLGGTFLPENGKITTSFSNNGQAMSSNGAQKNDLGHRLYYMVVDENGKVSQADMVPKMPFVMLGNMATSPPPPRISSSQEPNFSNISQANSQWYGLPPYPFGSTSYISSSPPSPPQGPPPSLSHSYVHGLPYPYPWAAPPPFTNEAYPSYPPQIRGEGGRRESIEGENGNRGGGGGQGFCSDCTNNNINNNNNI